MVQRFSYPGPRKSICTITSYNQKLKCHHIPSKNNHLKIEVTSMHSNRMRTAHLPNICGGHHQMSVAVHVGVPLGHTHPQTYYLSMSIPLPDIPTPPHTHLPLDIPIRSWTYPHPWMYTSLWKLPQTRHTHPKKGHGTRDTHPSVDRQTPVKI